MEERDSDGYKDILVKLQNLCDIDKFIESSIKFFLLQSSCTKIIQICNNSDTKIYTEVTELTQNPDNGSIKNHMKLLYTRTPLKLIYQTIKDVGSDYICMIVEHIRTTLKCTISPLEIADIIEVLLERYKNFIKTHKYFQEC